MAEPRLARTGPLAGRPHVSVAILPPTARLSVRGSAEAARRIGRAFGLDLPGTMLRAAEADRRAALRLGPDEWMLFAPEPDPALAPRLEAALDGEPGCVVDVSHREAGFDLAGAAAAPVLNAGCPLDLDGTVFPPGTCTRTLLGKADVVLWRRRPDGFRVGCWRSFAPYVMAFLREAAADCGA